MMKNLYPVALLSILAVFVMGCGHTYVVSDDHSPRTSQDIADFANALPASTSASTPVRVAAPTAPVMPIDTQDLGLGGDQLGLGAWTSIDEPLASGPAVKSESRRWEPVYFAFDQSAIGASERVKLERLADYLQTNPEVKITIEGHCDERGSEEYNRSLGQARAIAVQTYLKGLGVKMERLKTISYGEDKPADRGTSMAAHSRNRRAEFLVYQL